MKVAITGASGFVGRHVLAEFRRRGLSVIATRTGRREAGAAVPGIRWVSLDIHDRRQDAWELLERPDILLHLAWGGLPNYRSTAHFAAELPAQYSFLARMIEQGLSNLVVAGTCLEYGMQSGPLSAELETRPSTAYGFAKDSLRRQLQFLREAHSFRLTWARLFYVYGEGQSAASLFSQLREAVENKRGTFPMSRGEQLRDYLPIEEVARQLVDISLSGPDGTMNVCSGTPVSVRSLVERWIQEHGWEIRLDLGRYPYPDYEPMAFWGVPQIEAAPVGGKTGQ